MLAVWTSSGRDPDEQEDEYLGSRRENGTCNWLTPLEKKRYRRYRYGWNSQPEITRNPLLLRSSRCTVCCLRCRTFNNYYPSVPGPFGCLRRGDLSTSPFPYRCLIEMRKLRLNQENTSHTSIPNAARGSRSLGLGHKSHPWRMRATQKRCRARPWVLRNHLKI